MFWLLDTEHLFNGNESRLYFYLLKLSNSLYWKNPLTNADGYTASMVGISVNTLKTARNRLQQAGLIQFKPGGKGSRDKCIYHIVPANELLGKVSNSDTLSEKSLTPYLIPGLRKTDDISKHKPNQTKQKNTVVPAEPSPPVMENEKKEKQPEPYWDLIVKTWFDFNIEKFKDKPSFGDADPRYLKKIIEKLKTRAAAKSVQWNETTGPERLKVFLAAAFADPWLAKHFLLKNLNEQFDTIILDQKAALNGHQKKEAGQQVSKGPRSMQEEVDYLYERFCDGDLDPRVIRKDHYDLMTSRGMISFRLFKDAPSLEQMQGAVMDYFKTKHGQLV